MEASGKSDQPGLRIGIIGAGVSGIAAASIFNRNGHTTVLFEKQDRIGGVWAVSYPEVALQNTFPHYQLSEYPWPFRPDYHPTGADIERYLGMAVDHLDLDVRLEHEVVAINEQQNGWTLHYKNPTGAHNEAFDYLVVAVGQYTQWKHRPELSREGEYSGKILTERDVVDLEIFRNRKTVVVGFGKSAVDMATLAAEVAQQVDHVFRTPRWLIPYRLLGIHYAALFFCRASTVLMPCWDYPSRSQRFLHERMPWLVRSAWTLFERLFRRACLKHLRGQDTAAAERLRSLLPEHPALSDMRSAIAMCPVNYYQQIADGDILPHRSEVAHLTNTSVALDDGTEIECDQVLLCFGSETPRFPFFNSRYREMIETEPDGVQLYRHLIHPRIPRLAFAGYNHGFMHIPTVEVGTLWLCALIAGDLTLPEVDDMERSIDRIRQWKRDHINFEPSRSCAINTRFQQYIDVLLRDLGLRTHRKMPNIIAEAFAQCEARDYFGLSGEYERVRQKRSGPAPVQKLDM